MLVLLPVPQTVLPPEWCPRSPLLSGGGPQLQALWRHLLLVSRQRARSLRLPCPQLRCARLHLLRMHFGRPKRQYMLHYCTAIPMSMM